ncbi:hypothetical protein F5Y17DRAFT_216331 [Xylariaceae sp. FL0594]|nr:hypothetical protein F5Y17DRAFT_216331 [Xylariaceae sp. FL0594]
MPIPGPGVYEIVPYQAPELTMNAWDGKMDPGALVRTYTRDRANPSTNSLWYLALVAGSGDTAEYLIINVRTGYFLTATADNTIVSTPQISPADASAHRTLKYAPSRNYTLFTINSKISSRDQLTVKGASTESGADILAAPASDKDNTRWYFDRRT